MKNKEQIYDAEIYPLMGKIIEICQANKISMFATFDIPNDEDETLTCTTFTSDESGKPSERIRQFKRLAPQSRPPLMLTTEHADGSGEQMETLVLHDDSPESVANALRHLADVLTGVKPYGERVRLGTFFPAAEPKDAK